MTQHGNPHNEPANLSSQAAQISVSDFTEAIFHGVLRAVEARKLTRSPIIYGIILDASLSERIGGNVVSPAEINSNPGL